MLFFRGFLEESVRNKTFLPKVAHRPLCKRVAVTKLKAEGQSMLLDRHFAFSPSQPCIHILLLLHGRAAVSHSLLFPAARLRFQLNHVSYLVYTSQFRSIHG